jgi:hypothetical protein
MLTTTIEIIRSALKGDPSLNPADRAHILAMIRDGTNATKTNEVAASEHRLVRPAEAARRLGCSLRLVDQLAQDGILPRRYFPNRRRAAGFLESDLNGLMTRGAGK